MSCSSWVWCKRESQSPQGGSYKAQPASGMAKLFRNLFLLRFCVDKNLLQWFREKWV